MVWQKNYAQSRICASDNSFYNMGGEKEQAVETGQVTS